MLKKILLLTLAAALVSVSAGCKKKKPKAVPGQLTSIEKTKLKQNAIKAYEQILKEYPESPNADDAKKRLDALRK